MVALSLAEELFLLALHEEKGKVHDSLAMSVHYGLGGALLADLALHNMIAIDPKGKVIVPTVPMVERSVKLTACPAQLFAKPKLASG